VHADTWAGVHVGKWRRVDIAGDAFLEETPADEMEGVGGDLMELGSGKEASIRGNGETADGVEGFEDGFLPRDEAAEFKLIRLVQKILEQAFTETLDGPVVKAHVQI
jgi:hypothetical protein